MGCAGVMSGPDDRRDRSRDPQCSAEGRSRCQGQIRDAEANLNY